MKKIVDKISFHLNRKELAIFCGAGISVPSGIPPVGTYNAKEDILRPGIVTYILKEIGFSNNEAKNFFKTRLPFEAFIEFLLRHGLSIQMIKAAFEGSPSFYHYEIAKLVKHKKVRKIITTNFDQCIEKALRKVNVNDTIVYHKLNDLKKGLSKVHTSLLVKVHGCISDISNIAITIQQIAKHESLKRNSAISHFFSRTATHKVLLILGYSCSDHFDVSPQVQYLIKSKKKQLCQLIYWEYQYGQAPKYVSGKMINDNAQKVLNSHPKISYIKGDLRFLFEGLTSQKFFSVKNARWVNSLNQYLAKLNSSEKKLIKARLMYETNQLAKANGLLSEIEKDGTLSRRNLAVVYSSRALIFKNWGRMDEALEMHRKEEEIYGKLRNKKGLAISFGNQALVQRRLGNYEEAIRLHNKEASLCKEMHDKIGRARSYGNHALVLKYQNKLDQALSFHEREIDICVRIGDKKGEARSYGNQSLIYRRKKRYKKALSLLKKEEEIYDNYGFPALMVAHNFETQALIFGDLKKYDDAISMHKRAEEIYEALNNKWGLITSYSNQGELLVRQRAKKNEGIQLVEKAIKLSRKTKDGRINHFITLLDDLRNL